MLYNGVHFKLDRACFNWALNQYFFAHNYPSKALCYPTTIKMAMMMMEMTMGSSNVEATVHYLTRSNASLTCLAHFEIIIIGNIYINGDALKSLLDSSLGPLLD